MHRFAREAHDMGIRYIGGCCGFLPYHIRAIAEELAEERGQLPLASEKHIPWAGGLMMHTKPWVRARASRDYWEKMKPAAGRPFCPSMSCPDNWGVTQGDTILKQQKEETSKEDIEELQREQASIREREGESNVSHSRGRSRLLLREMFRQHEDIGHHFETTFLCNSTVVLIYIE